MKKNPELNDIITSAWLGLGDISNYAFGDPLKQSIEDVGHYGLYPLRLMQNPEYLAYTCKKLLNIELLPEQAVILYELWTKPYPMFVASRGFGKSSLLAIYAMLRMVLTPPANSGGAGAKLIIVGAAFRQSKLIYDYMEVIWNNAPMLRSVCGRVGKYESGFYKDNDKFTVKVGPNWACAIPIGNGEKIRGLRATHILCDEFGSIPLEIFETVIQGFSAVSVNPVDGVKKHAEKKIKKSLGLWTNQDDHIFDNRTSNQTILSGTATYDFQHFADYWKKYKKIIESKGDTKILESVMGGEIPDGFDWRDFSIVRLPSELVPAGFLDPKALARAKATVHSGIFLKEYSACFTKDSLGFFKRSIIEACIASESNISNEGWPKWCETVFDVQIKGFLTRKYVMAIDPASEADNFSIVILELHEEHARVVYCWTTNKKDFNARKKAGFTSEDNFYSFAARRIRDLLKTFPCERIGIDGQGGGIAVLESLHDKKNLYEGEVQIWPIINPEKPAETDIESGLHIVEVIQFSKYDWVYEANHGLRKDLEDKMLLFPRFDVFSLTMSEAEDMEKVAKFERENPGKTLKLYDTLEECVGEIEDLKDELTSIVVSRAGTGVNSRDRWDTPEIKLSDNKKGRVRKDRYSALLMANMIARQARAAKAELSFDFGGLMSDIDTKGDGELYTTASDSFREAMNEIVGLL